MTLLSESSKDIHHGKYLLSWPAVASCIFSSDEGKGFPSCGLKKPFSIRFVSWASLSGMSDMFIVGGCLNERIRSA